MEDKDIKQEWFTDEDKIRLCEEMEELMKSIKAKIEKEMEKKNE